MMVIFMFALLVCGVFGNKVSVMEGDSVTLPTGLNGTQRDEIKWWFGPEGSPKLLVHIDGSTPKIKNVEGFKDRLQISDVQNGNLIIKNMRKNHTGLYRAMTEGADGTFEKSFNVNVNDAPDDIDVGTGEVKSVSKTVGESVTLNTDVKLQKDALIVWRFGHKNVLIAKDDVEDNKTPEYPDVLDVRFRDRLQVNNQTGDLFISKVTYTDSGDYKLKISSNKEIIHKTFSLSVIGVFGDEVKSVMEGDSLTLPTGLNGTQRNEIKWWFGPEGSSILLVQIVGSKPDIKKNEGFKDRLQISDIQNGNLTIKNMRKKHTGLYKAEIGGATGTVRRFNVNVNDAPGEIDCDTGEVNPVSKTVGDSVTLNTDVKLQKDALILWRFGHKNILIAKDDVEDNKTLEYPDVLGGRFKGRLQVNDQTGDLTIRKIRTEDSGDYKLKISSNKQIIHKTFSLFIRGGWPLSAVVVLCVGFLLVIAAGIAFSVILYRRKKPTVTVSVYEGDSATLSGAKSELQTGTQIEWKFKGHVIMIGKMTKDKVILVTYRNDQQFNVRLELNPYFGSLIIKNISKENTGLYEVKITNNKKTSHTRFQVNVIDKIVSVSEGDPVILHGARSELQTGAQIEWKFNNHVIMTGVKTEDREIRVTHSDDQKFKDRLELGDQVGYLTINKVSKEDAGLYEVNITYNKQTSRFKSHVKVTGKDPLQGDMTVLSVIEGDPVTIPGAKSEVQPGVQIVWTLNNRVIITGRKANDEGILESYIDDQQFKDRLELNSNLGSLIIKSISMKDSGYYEITITNDEETSRTRIRFKVTVSPRTNKNEPEPTAGMPLLSV